jgi:hypothetical protein
MAQNGPAIEESDGKAKNADGDARRKAADDEGDASRKRAKRDVPAALFGAVRVCADHNHEDGRGKIGDCG